MTHYKDVKEVRKILEPRELFTNADKQSTLQYRGKTKNNEEWRKS